MWGIRRENAERNIDLDHFLAKAVQGSTDDFDLTPNFKCKLFIEAFCQQI